MFTDVVSSWIFNFVMIRNMQQNMEQYRRITTGREMKEETSEIFTTNNETMVGKHSKYTSLLSPPMLNHLLDK